MSSSSSRATAADLRRIAEGRPPFTSVHLSVDSTHEDLPTRLAILTREVADRLEAQGTPRPVVDEIVARLERGHHGPGRCVIVDGEGVVTDRALRQVVPLVASHGPLPRLGPVLVTDQASPAALLAVVDRVGADLVALPAGPDDHRHEREVEGRDHPLTKSAPGGWSQRRYQQRAENTWEQNAAGVAEEVAALAHEVGAELVVVAGDDRAADLLEEHLPADLRRRVQRAEHGTRADDGSGADLDAELDRILATWSAEQTVAALREFTEQRDRHGPVADGPDATFAALRRGLVDTLLVHDAADDDRTAWIDLAAPTLVATGASTLRDLGHEPIAAPLVDVALHAALLTGAVPVAVPRHGAHVPRGGIGALLRAPLEPADAAAGGGASPQWRSRDDG